MPCIPWETYNTIGFLPWKQNTEYYIPSHLPKIIILTKQGPKKKKRGTESGREAKQEIGHRESSINWKLEIKCCHRVPRPPGFKNERVRMYVQHREHGSGEWHMIRHEILCRWKDLTQNKSLPLFAALFLNWNLSVQQAPCSAQLWALELAAKRCSRSPKKLLNAAEDREENPLN